MKGIDEWKSKNRGKMLTIFQKRGRRKGTSLKMAL